MQNFQKSDILIRNNFSKSIKSLSDELYFKLKISSDILMNPKILIFGAYGFLGSYLCDYLKDNYKIYKIGRNPNSQIQVKRFNQRDIQKIIKLIKPNIIINLIAETDVDLCEKKKNIV